jgi:very-short-patch-repair endonuclease
MNPDYARELRTAPSDAERHLWSRVRGRELGGWKFRRQVPIGQFIADFACLEAMLLIELDGGQHAEPEVVASDDRRTRWLESLGYRVLRFWNDAVFQDTDSVVEAIAIALDSAGRPSSSRRSKE